MRNKSLGTVLSIGFLLIAGCATTLSNFPYSTVSIHNVPYFALTPMCEREGIRWDYDPLSQIIILKSQGKDVKLLIGSKAIMIGNTSQQLKCPIEIKDSVIYAPLDLKNYIGGSLYPLPQKSVSASSVYLRSIESVVLDAGHGGRDPGALGKYGLKEKTIVFDVVEKIKSELERKGLKVYLTRTSDEFIPLLERPRIAGEKRADLFVSIHANANRSRWIEGFEVYYLTESVDDNARALAAAENAPLEIDNQPFRNQLLSLKAMLWDMIYTENRKESIELAQYISRAVSQKMNLKLLGVKGAPFVVLKGARMPAVLVELGYISNGEGEKKLRDTGYRQEMAEAIATGIMNFKNYSEGKK